MNAPRVVVAPDKFKGSLTAAEVAEALAHGLRSSVPGADIVEHPVADGGEGTVDVALRAGFAPVTCTVPGPLGVEVQATYARCGDRAVVEMASAAGLALVGTPDDDTAIRASTYGVGVLIAHALDHGARQVVLGLGGSATTDGGAGMIDALAARPDPAGVDLVLACDVDNPLTGPNGAAAIYAPQKGAGPATIARLERRLSHWADEVATIVGRDLRSVPGAGAAGGTAFAGLAMLGARLAPGIDVLMEISGFPRAVDGADLLIVGEGALDAQSLRGKGPVGVAAFARQRVGAVIAVAGRCDLTAEQLRGAGIEAVYTLTDLDPRPEVCMAHASRFLGQVGALIARDWVRADEPGR